MTTTMKRAWQIASKWDMGFERSPEDGSWATAQAMPRVEAEALVGALQADGIEASWAPDGEDSSRAWVHVTADE